MPFMRNAFQSRRWRHSKYSSFGRRNGRKWYGRRKKGLYNKGWSVPRPTTTTLSGQTTIPDQMNNKMVWIYPMTTYSPGIGFSVRAFFGNNIFAPDANASGVSTQPYGMDQIATLWQQYTVTGSAIELTVENLITSNSCSFCLVPSTNSSSYANFDDARADPKALPPVLLGSSTSGWKTMHTFKAYKSTAEMEGLPPSTILNDDTYSAAVTSSPTNQWYWTIYTQPTGGNSSYRIQLKMIYYVRWSKRYNLALGT